MDIWHPIGETQFEIISALPNTKKKPTVPSGCSPNINMAGKVTGPFSIGFIHRLNPGPPFWIQSLRFFHAKKLAKAFMDVLPGHEKKLNH